MCDLPQPHQYTHTHPCRLAAAFVERVRGAAGIIMFPACRATEYEEPLLSIPACRSSSQVSHFHTVPRPLKPCASSRLATRNEAQRYPNRHHRITEDSEQTSPNAITFTRPTWMKHINLTTVTKSPHRCFALGGSLLTGSNTGQLISPRLAIPRKEVDKMWSV